MVNVALINPPTIVNMDSLSFHNSLPPLGLAYISAALKQAQHSVQVIDAPGEAVDSYRPMVSEDIKELYIHGLSPEEIVSCLDAEIQVVGISNMFLHEWPLLKHLLKLIREKLPEACLVLGGETPSAFWQQMLKESDALDICVLGEGDLSFVELLKHIENPEIHLAQVGGIAYRSADGSPIKSKAVSKRIKEVDELPWPDWEAFQVDAYLDCQYSSGVKRGRSLPMISSRGCPYQCTFCSSPNMWTTRYVTRDPEKFADEIEHYIQRYQITNVDLHDLTSMLTKRWILKFCEVMERRNIHISWQLPSGTRCEALDEETLTALYRSGCRNLSYSPESGSPELLEAIKKRVKTPVLIQSVKAAVKQNIISNVNFIIGLPGETGRDLWNTYKLILQLAWSGAHSTAVMAFNPYPGSALFDQLYAEGQIELNDEYYYSSLLRSGKSTVSYNPNTSPRMLVWVQYVFLLSFFGIQYLRYPKRVFTLLHKLLTKAQQETNMEQFLSTKWMYWKKKRELQNGQVQVIDLTSSR